MKCSSDKAEAEMRRKEAYHTGLVAERAKGSSKHGVEFNRPSSSRRAHRIA